MSSKTKTTATKEEATPALVPKLRFPEYRGTEGWDSGPLKKSLSSISNGLALEQGNGTSGCRVTRIETILAGTIDLAKVGLIQTSEDISAYKLRVGDILLSNINSVAHIGKSVFVDRDYDLYHGMNLLRLEVNRNQHDPKFIFYAINTDWIRASLRERANKAVNQASINQTELGKTEVFLPLKPEQQKIAECLSSLDELMAAQARKVDALKTHKKGLMQQLFPREGETQPRLRFPEFQNAGEWVAKTLDAVAPLQRGFDLPSDEIRPGSVPIVYSNGPKGFHERGMAKGPGLVTGRSGTIGKLHFIESGDYWPHNTSLWVTSFKGHAPKFVYYLYESIGFLRFASGSGVPTLNRNDAHSYETSVPSDREEQERIAACLSSLDALITAETQKHEALKTHKRGLMQQLFPTPEEAIDS